MPPQFERPHPRLGKVGCLLLHRLDHAAADVAAADIDSKQAVVALEYPRRREVRAADQPCLIGIEPDRHHLHLKPLGPEDDVGTRDGKFADPTLPEAATDHDGFGLLPGLALEETPGNEGQLLRELLDRAVNQGCSFDVIADQNFVELLLAQFG